MLRSTGLFRAVTALLTVGLALQGATPLVEGACPMHGAVTSTAEAVAVAPHSVGHDGHAAAHVGHGATSGLAHAPTLPTEAPDHSCACDTDCCGVPTAALVARSPRPPLAGAWVPDSPRGNPAPSRNEPTVRLLPFPNGPPVLPIG
jgi:hypothetical protein